MSPAVDSAGLSNLAFNLSPRCYGNANAPHSREHQSRTAKSLTHECHDVPMKDRSPEPSVCSRMTTQAALAGVLAVLVLTGVTSARQAFDAISVKPSPAGSTRGGILPTRGGQFRVVALTLRELIELAYGGSGGALFDDQIV